MPDQTDQIVDEYDFSGGERGKYAERYKAVPLKSPLLVIVTGPPGAGKTTLGKRLAADLELPFLHKDGIKERLHEGLGTPNLDTSRRMGRVSFDLLYWAVEALLLSKTSVVVEANFARAFASLPFQNMITAHCARSCQIVCYAPPAVLRERILARREAGERHAAHHDTQALAGFPDDLPAVTAEYTTLDLEGETILLDTTDFARVDYASLRAHLGTLLDSACLGNPGAAKGEF